MSEIIMLVSCQPGDIVKRDGREYRVGVDANAYGGIYVTDLETNKTTIQPLFREYEPVSIQQNESNMSLADSVN